MINRDDVIRMAREAEFSELHINALPNKFERFAALVAAKEREACAKVCEDDSLSSQYGERSKYRELLASTLRARGKA